MKRARYPLRAIARIRRSGHVMLAAGLLLLASQVCGVEPDRPVSLSIGGVFSDTLVRLEQVERQQIVLRDHITTDLVARYDCVVQMRARGLSVAAERALDSLQRIREATTETIHLPAVDYTFGLNFVDHRQQGAQVAGNVQAVAIATEEHLETEFTASNADQVPERVVETLATMIGLRPRRAMDPDPEGDPGAAHRWAVLPFIRMDLAAHPADDELALKLELSLQEALGAGRLVARRELDAIMLEKKIRAIGSSLDVQHLGHFAGADYFLMGQVAQWRRGLRVNLQVVEALSGSIVDAVALEGLAVDNLHDPILKAAARLVRTPRKPIPQRSATREERQAEFNAMMEKIKYRATHSDVRHAARTAMLDDSFLSILEGGALLLHDDPETRNQNLRYMPVRLLHFYASWGDPALQHPSSAAPRAPVHRLSMVGRTRDLLVALTDLDASTPSMPAPRVLLAAVHYVMRQPDVALALVEQHETLHPGVNEAGVAFVRSICLWSQKRHEEAMEWMQSAVRKSPSTTRGVDFDYRSFERDMRNSLRWIREEEALQARLQTGGEAGELAVLKELFTPESRVYNIPCERWARFLELTEKLETPEFILGMRPESLLVRKGVTDHAFYSNRLRRIQGKPPGRAVLDLWLLQARTLLRMGRKEDALRKARDVEVSASGAMVGAFRREMQKHRDAAREFIAAVEADTGPVEEFWKTAAQLDSALSDYALCVIPDADMPKVYLDGVAEALRDFFGPDRVRILPSVRGDDAAIQDPAGTLRQWMAQTGIPENALWVVFVTHRNLRDVAPLGGYGGRWPFHAVSARNVPEVGERAPYNPVLFSGYARMSPRNRNHIARVMARAMVYTFHFLYEPEAVQRKHQFSDRNYVHYFRCGNPPCIFSSLTDGNGYLRHQMCRDCQARFVQADFQGIHRRLIDTCRQMGATIVPANREPNE